MRLISSINNLKRCNGYAVASFFLFCILFSKSTAAIAFEGPADSLKNKYVITDPRNPGCACHMYQNMADKEFRKLLKKERADKQSGNVAKNTNADGNKLKVMVTKRTKIFFWKSKKYKTPAFKKRRSRKATFMFFFKRDIAACPE